MADLDEINEELDKLLLSFFEILAKLYNEQDDLGLRLQDGFLHMSRARYNMGAKSVGVMQYDENNMKASVKIDVMPPSGKNFDDDTFILNKDSNLYCKSGPNASGDSGLRKRNVGSEKVESVGLKSSENKAEAKPAPVQDPIKWFGVLVPQSLRQSQTNFNSAIKSAVHIANLKHKLTDLQGQYTDLLSKKMELLKV